MAREGPKQALPGFQGRANGLRIAFNREKAMRTLREGLDRVAQLETAAVFLCDKCRANICGTLFDVLQGALTLALDVRILVRGKKTRPRKEQEYMEKRLLQVAEQLLTAHDVLQNRSGKECSD